MKKISWKNFFISLSFWDTAVCLHFWAKFKMAARGRKRVASQVFWSFLNQIFFSTLQFIKVKIEGVWNCPMIFVFTFVTTYKSTNSWLRKKTIVWHQNDFGRQEIFSKFSSILLKYVLYLLKNIFRQFCIFELEIVTMSHGKYL